MSVSFAIACRIACASTSSSIASGVAARICSSSTPPTSAGRAPRARAASIATRRSTVNSHGRKDPYSTLRATCPG